MQISSKLTKQAHHMIFWFASEEKEKKTKAKDNKEIPKVLMHKGNHTSSAICSWRDYIECK